MSLLFDQCSLFLENIELLRFFSFKKSDFKTEKIFFFNMKNILMDRAEVVETIQCSEMIYYF